MEPSTGDAVVAVSHTWEFDRHPDPAGHQLRLLQRLLDPALGLGSGTCVFLDFLSPRGVQGVAGGCEWCPAFASCVSNENRI